MAQIATTATIRTAIATRSGRRRRRAAASISPEFASSVMAGLSCQWTSRLRLAVADAWIDQRIGEIDDKIDDDDEEGKDDGRSLHQRDVALLHSFDGQRAQAGKREGDFDE